MKQKKLNILKRVLIVDDDQDIRLALRALLRDASYEVVGEAADGKRAMELLIKHKPAIVLLDITMPGVSGLDVLTNIKSEFPITQVVMISSDATSEHVTTSLERGASGFIVKPFNFNNVIKNIERALVEATAAVKKAKNQVSSEQSPESSKTSSDEQTGLLNKKPVEVVKEKAKTEATDSSKSESQ